MGDSKRDTGIEDRLLDSVGEGEGGMIWENSIETRLLPYVKQITSPSLACETALSSCALGLRDGMGREVGGGFGTWGHMYTRGWFMSVYDKDHHNIVK